MSNLFGKRKISFLLASLLAVSVSMVGCQSTGKTKAAQKGPARIAAAPSFHVKILGINDLHGQLDVTRKFNGRNVGRVDYLAAYLKQREAETKDTLLVHAGDAVGASPPVSALRMDEPTIDILNELKFDVGTIGNHEFDRGFNEMMRLIHGGTNPTTGKFKGANFPYVCANLVNKGTGQLVLPPYVIKRVRGVPIGIIGVVLKETPNIVMPSHVAGLQFLDEAESINKAAAELKQKGVKSIIVLAHNPGTSDQNGQNPSGEIVDITKKVDKEVDVIFCGHSHQYMNSVIDGKLVVQSYCYGTHFSDVDLEINPATKNIVSKKAEIVPVYQDAIQPDPTITKMIKNDQAKVGPIINQVIGTAAQDITRIQDDNGESALGNLIADSQRVITKADFAFMNPGGIRADLAKGQVKWGDAYSIQPFQNDMITMTLSGDQIRHILNQQWHPDYRAMLQIAGLKYTWDDARPIGNKVVDILLSNGSKIDPTADYKVAVNSYLASGGDKFTVFAEGTNRVVGPVDLDAFANYVKQLKQPFSAAIEGRIQKLASSAGTKSIKQIPKSHLEITHQNSGGLPGTYGTTDAHGITNYGGPGVIISNK